MKTKLGTILSALLLLAVLALPSINQWVHLAEDHHLETQCSENKLHFHAVEMDCSLNATFTSPYTSIDIFSFSLFEAQEEPFLPLKKEQKPSVVSKAFFHLRAPPFLL